MGLRDTPPLFRPDVRMQLHVADSHAAPIAWDNAPLVTAGVVPAPACPARLARLARLARPLRPLPLVRPLRRTAALAVPAAV
jgi:hypothetical protein